jgi:integrase/recombinase XerD
MVAAYCFPNYYTADPRNEKLKGIGWIQMKRHKTNKMISVPLLPKAKAKLFRYDVVGDYALPKFSNQKIHSYLKEIAE